MANPTLCRVVDMHTAGEPVRIIVDGYPRLKGASLLEKRQDAFDHHDIIRRQLMLEPRGHADMYGVIPTTPSHPEAQLAVLFTHNSGYSTMCGHATIAIGRWAVESGLVARRDPVTEFGLEAPCGLVRVFAHGEGAGIGRVAFESVPSFASHLDLAIDVPGLGAVTLDIAYGGAFYAILPASRIGLELGKTSIEELRAAAIGITTHIRRTVPVRHPSEPALGFLYGTILTDDGSGSGGDWSDNICVFGEGQIDRSPTGSGVTARLALAHAKGESGLEIDREYRGVSGIGFTGQVARVLDNGEIVALVGGRSYYTGRADFTVEDGDALKRGFTLSDPANPAVFPPKVRGPNAY